MRRTVSLALISSCLLVACRSSTPATRYYDAADYYATTLEQLTVVRQAGKMSDRTHARLIAIAKSVDVALDDWYAQLQDADPTGDGSVDISRSVLRAVREGINQMALYLAQHKER